MQIKTQEEQLFFSSVKYMRTSSANSSRETIGKSMIFQAVKNTIDKSMIFQAARNSEHICWFSPKRCLNCQTKTSGFNIFESFNVIKTDSSRLCLLNRCQIRQFKLISFIVKNVHETFSSSCNQELIQKGCEEQNHEKVVPSRDNGNL